MTTAAELQERRAEVQTRSRQKKPAPVRRLNLNLPEKTFEELQRLAAETGRTLTEMIRIGISLAQVAVDEDARGRKLAVINQEGQVLKEIVPLR
jgi:Ribbon-helix-helix protein, copG family